MLYRPETSRRGIAAVEMAMIAPVLLALLMGLWEVGRYLSIQNLLDSAAREGGRMGSSGAYFSSNNRINTTAPFGKMSLPPPSQNTDFELQKKVLLYLQAAGVSTANASVTVTNTGTTLFPKNWTYTYLTGVPPVPAPPAANGYDPTAAAGRLDQLSITITLPYQNIAWSPISWFIDQSSTMTAKASWNSMVDEPLTVSLAIPTKPLQPGDPLP